MLDIHTIGAGGGSIAWIDDGGALRVGPASAGSHPGPACYDQGGTRPTVTDADVLLGFIDPDFFLGGEIRLDKGQAEAAIVREIGTPLGMDAHEAALALSDIVNNNMSNAMHFVTTKRGFDPRDFARCSRSAAPVRCMPVARPRTSVSRPSSSRASGPCSVRWAMSSPTSR